jgi:hypothetical protein
LDDLYAKHGDRVEFYMVYIREAHPTDGWKMASNDREGILVKQPTSVTERVAVCELMCEKLNIKLPPLIDGINDEVNKAYSAWPDRLYLVGKDGRIAYQGGPGPGGFKPGELEQAIAAELKLK